MTDDAERLDAPNQQVVRPDQSGPADEGKGAGKATRKGKDDTPEPNPARRGPGRPRRGSESSEGDSPDDAGNDG